VDADAKPTLPAGYTAISESLLITQGQTIGVQIDRESGVASGDAWDMVLSRDALAEEGIQSTLFVRPTDSASLVADLSATETTKIEVDDVTGFASSGSVYIGRERITYASVDSGNDYLQTLTRGVLGYAYEFDSDDPGSYGVVTDTPQVWRGRWVSLHAHLVSPAGHMLDDTWLTGTYHRVLWRGYVDTPPRPGPYGMTLRVLPLVRIAAREIGSGISGTVRQSFPLADGSYDFEARAKFDDYPVYVTPFDTVTLTLSVDNSGITEVPPLTVSAVAANTVLTVGAYRSLLIAAVNTAWTGQTWFDSVSDGGIHPLAIRVVLASGYTAVEAAISLVPSTYWLKQHDNPYVLQGYFSASGLYGVDYSAGIGQGDPRWIPISQMSGIGLMDQAIPSTGFGVLSQEDRKEVFRWDSADTTLTGIAVVRVADRAILGKKVNLSLGPADFEVAIGDIAKPGEVIRRVLTSSGTTLRGTDDTLGTGYALDGDWAPESSISDVLPAATWLVPMLSTGAGSLADLAGGLLALGGKALVQRRSSTGELVLAVVDTTPAPNVAVNTSVAAADVESSGVGMPALADGPTGIEIDIGSPHLDDKQTLLVGSRHRMLSEGARIWKLSVPGLPVISAAQSAVALLEGFGGETLVEMPIAPWVDLQPGDKASITAAHPLMYDWDNGSYGVASVAARVVGWRMDLRTGATTIKLLAASGAGRTPLALCPTATIDTKNSTTDFDLTAGEGAYFAAGDSIQFYTPGDEGTEKETRVIDTITTDNITLTVAASAWVAAGSRVTYPTNASATSAQDTGYLYVRSDKHWEG
jgi:hypothetical protein